jgi:hypothetical protein
MSEDARVTLDVAFQTGIAPPTRVLDHYFYIKCVCGFHVEFHHFRVGYATFVVSLIEPFPAIVWDFELEDGLPIYPI